MPSPSITPQEFVAKWRGIPADRHDGMDDRCSPAMNAIDRDVGRHKVCPYIHEPSLHRRCAQ